LEATRLEAGGELNRAGKLELAKQVAEERELSDAAHQALEIIIEDGTSVVFPRVVEGLRDDLTRVGELLDAQRTDKYTNVMQKEIETTLEELIEALQKVQKDKKAGGGGGGGGGGEPPLLPNSAELKLLRASQLRVNRRTAAFEETRPADQLDDVLKAEVRSIAVRQLEIAIMTEQIVERN
jgi:hypothetical protein